MNIEEFEYNPLVEKLVNILMVKTQNYDPHFFRTQVNFYLNLLPSSLNIIINSPLTTKIPINMYVIALAGSGVGWNKILAPIQSDLYSKFL